MRRLSRPLLLGLCVLALAGCPGDDDGTSPVVDADDDGISDDDEVQAGSDPDDPLSVPDDRDGDGVTNDAESDAGSDPDDPSDVPEPDVSDGSDDDEPDDPTSDPGSSSPCEGDGCPDTAAATPSCDPSDFAGCDSFEIEQQCTNHGDNGPILTTNFGGFSDVLLTISNPAEIPDDVMVQLVYLDEDTERISLSVSGRTLKAAGGAAVFVVPIQEADKAHTFSHVLVNGERVETDAGTSLDFTSGPFTETGRCTTEEIDAAQAQVEADGTDVG